MGKCHVRNNLLVDFLYVVKLVELGKEMNSTDPAFPTKFGDDGEQLVLPTRGLTSRAYAAIHLRVPDSGEEWLDKMIRESLRDEFAKEAMKEQLVTEGYLLSDQQIAKRAYEVANSMLEQRGKK